MIKPAKAWKNYDIQVPVLKVTRSFLGLSQGVSEHQVVSILIVLWRKKHLRFSHYIEQQHHQTLPFCNHPSRVLVSLSI